MSKVYYFPKLPLELCAPAYVLYKDHPVRDIILNQIEDLFPDIAVNGLKDPLIAEVRKDRLGIPRLVTTVGIRRWTCLDRLNEFSAPYLIRSKKNNSAIKEAKKFKYKKIDTFKEAIKLFGNKDAPGTLVVRRWFSLEEENVVSVCG